MGSGHHNLNIRVRGHVLQAGPELNDTTSPDSPGRGVHRREAEDLYLHGFASIATIARQRHACHRISENRLNYQLSSGFAPVRRH